MSVDTVTYMHLDSPLGPMIAGATDKGLCLLEWHDRGGVERIAARVMKRYKCEMTEGVSTPLETLQRELQEYFHGELMHHGSSA